MKQYVDFTSSDGVFSQCFWCAAEGPIHQAAVRPKEKPSPLCGFFPLCLESYWLSSNPLYVFVTRFARNQIIAALLHKPLAQLLEILLCRGHSGLLHSLLRLQDHILWSKEKVGWGWGSRYCLFLSSALFCRLSHSVPSLMQADS